MTPVRAITAAFLISLLAAACGDVYADPIPSQATPSDVAFTVDASATIPKDFVSACPTRAPVEGASCNTPGLTCEYGSSPDMRCNTTVACVPDASFGGAWTARPSILCPTYECPKGLTATIDGTPCDLPSTDAGPPTDADELVCPMTDGVCACSTGVDAAHAHARRWVCAKPRDACPTVRPLVGQACSSSRSCDYGSCDFKRGTRMECDFSVSFTWFTGAATCN